MTLEEGVNPYAAPASPAAHVEPLSPVSVKQELREWLGLTPADLLVYLAVASTAAMFFTRVAAIDAALATFGLLLSIAACSLGMRRDPRVSRFTNLVKVTAYPACAGLMLLVVVVHYLYWAGH